jgi:hypothetical protein
MLYSIATHQFSGSTSSRSHEGKLLLPLVLTATASGSISFEPTRWKAERGFLEPLPLDAALNMLKVELEADSLTQPMVNWLAKPKFQMFILDCGVLPRTIKQLLSQLKQQATTANRESQVLDFEIDFNVVSLQLRSTLWSDYAESRWLTQIGHESAILLVSYALVGKTVNESDRLPNGRTIGEDMRLGLFRLVKDPKSEVRARVCVCCVCVCMKVSLSSALSYALCVRGTH